MAQAVAPAISSLRLDTVEGRIGRTMIAAVAGGVGAKLGGGKFLNGAVTGAFSRFYNDELHIALTARISTLGQIVGRIIFGKDFIGKGGKFGFAVSFPDIRGGVVVGNLKQFDIGVFVQGSAGGIDGDRDFGIGRMGLELGANMGDLLGLEGRGTEFFAAATGVGVGVNLDSNNNFVGGSLFTGLGLQVGGVGTLTRVFSLRRAIIGAE